MDADTLYTCAKYVEGSNVDVFVVLRDYVNNIHYIGNKYFVILCNTADSGSVGSHWALFFTYLGSVGPVCEWYDSFGKRPEFYGIHYQYPVVRINHN